VIEGAASSSVTRSTATAIKGSDKIDGTMHPVSQSYRDVTRGWPFASIVIDMLWMHHNASIANLHLGPSTLGDGVDAEQTVAPIGGEKERKSKRKAGIVAGVTVLARGVRRGQMWRHN
jgi:hypothetical protein